ncbi:MAG TPA: hypothetical protein VLL05_13555, partial [Terriglobales bacterium]|nr:hypothetical protein [Terriglobales bacterium]
SMSEEKIGGHNADTGFEQEDLSPQGVFYFMGGLAVLGVAIYFILAGMYRYLDNYDRTHQPPANPMAATTGVDPQTMTYPQIQSQVQKTFPKPVLENSEQMQFVEELEKQNEVLGSYDWIDQERGVVRIPIDRAMDLVAQRGLPVLPEGEAAHANSGDKAGNGKAAKLAAPAKK